jgi:hypothetical protein
VSERVSDRRMFVRGSVGVWYREEKEALAVSVRGRQGWSEGVNE